MTAGTENPLLPTGTDRELARIEITEAYPNGYPEDYMRTVEAEHLVPGDAFAARGRTYTVTGFPTVLRGLEQVAVPIVPVEGIRDEFECVRGRKVVAWRTRRANYGRVKCTSCRCLVGRDHQTDSEDCRLLQIEREAKNHD